jgi:hypothetical protein
MFVAEVADTSATEQEKVMTSNKPAAYRQYRARVPRWLGLPRGGSDTGRTR